VRCGTREYRGHELKRTHSYAFWYRTRYVFCYDAFHLLIVRWKERNLDQSPEMLLIPVGGRPTVGGVPGMQVREAMYRLVCESINEQFGGGRERGHEIWMSHPRMT
jgi:hypothetical protein